MELNNLRGGGKHSTNSKIVGAICDSLFSLLNGGGSDTNNRALGEELLCLLEL